MNRNARFWLLLGAALVVVVLIVGGSGDSGPAYDPRSVAPDGARGVVETLERLGAMVDLDRSVPNPSATTALMLRDRLTVEDEDAVRTWVQAGGVLVVADVNSRLAAQAVGFTNAPVGGRPTILRGRCTIEVLAETTELTLNGRLLNTAGRTSCFGDANSAFVVAESVVQGTIVTIGSPDLFINAELDDDDAAVVAVNLLAPTGGDAHVSFLGPSVVDFGDEAITDLVPPRVWNAVFQMLAAFLLYSLYRSRRLGGVVPEPVPVHIEGSELVLKAGLLSERAKDPGSAAQVLQTDLVHRIRVALSVPATATDADVATRVADRTGHTPAEVEHGLYGLVATDPELVQTAQLLHTLDAQLFDTAGANKAMPVRTPDQQAPRDIPTESTDR